MSKREAQQQEKVFAAIREIRARPHHPGECPSKGLFGRDCPNCITHNFQPFFVDGSYMGEECRDCGAYRDTDTPNCPGRRT